MKLKNERIIRALFYDAIKNSNKKGAAGLLNTTEHVRSIINIKTIEPCRLLPDLENKELLINETVCLQGYLSIFGCMSEPETYTPVIYKRGVKNKVNGDIPMSVRPLSPPVSNFITEEMCIAFLYTSDDNPFLFHKDKYSKPAVKDFNKFLPIIMTFDEFTEYTENFVEIHCSMKDILNDEIKKLFKYRNQEFYKLSEWFINIGYIRHPFIQLTAQSIKKKDQKSLVNQTSVFAAEYRIIKPENMPNDYFKTLFDKAFTSAAGYKDDFRSMYIRDTGFSYLFTRNEDITVIQKGENSIGFFIEINFMNIADYSSKITNIHSCIMDFRKDLKRSIHLDLVFLSDMRKFLDFQLQQNEHGRLPCGKEDI